MRNLFSGTANRLEEPQQLSSIVIVEVTATTNGGPCRLLIAVQLLPMVNSLPKLFNSLCVYIANDHVLRYI